MDDKAYFYFQTGFQKCKEQFEESGVIPAIRENFSNPGKATNSLSDEAVEEMGKKDNDIVGPEWIRIVHAFVFPDIGPCIVFYNINENVIFSIWLSSLLLVI